MNADWWIAALAPAILAASALACSGTEDAPGQVPGVSTVELQQTAALPTAAPEPSAQQARTPTPSPASLLPVPQASPPPQPSPTAEAEYDSTENMFRLFSGRDHDPDDTRQAIALAIANNDKSIVPLMIEMLRFFGNQELLIESSTAISVITGREFRRVPGAWNEWMEWLGLNPDEYRPPDGYVEWKSMLMSLIDPRFGEFLAPAAHGSRINLVEVAWGGVRPDGIPDLQNAPVAAAGEQEYLQPRDRVFGVSINGEHRAYPLRIVNAHEMANDVLGGEPIALAY